MLTGFAAGALTLFTLASLAPPGALAQQTDTTINVQRGTRLDVENFAGEVVIGTWDRDAVRIAATHSEGDRLEFEDVEAILSVHATGKKGPSKMVEFQISVPAWIALDVAGVYTDVDVRGVQADVTVETVEGDVSVRGGQGFVSLASVQGDVSLAQSRGRIALSSVNAGIQLTDAAGEVTAETVNGEIVLDRVEATSVDASTVNGSISYDGSISDGGRYAFATHNGDISVAVPEGANVAVSVATFGGEFESSFPVTLTEARRGKRLSFVLGTGRARLELESFQGLIELRRPGKPKKPDKPDKPGQPAMRERKTEEHEKAEPEKEER